MEIKDILQIIMAFFGSLCFTMFFNVHGKRIFINACGGMIGWAFYLLVYKTTGSIFQGYFYTAILITFSCEVLARVLKAPTTMMIVPMLFPEIPGGDLYRTVFNLFQGNMEGFMNYGTTLAIEIAALNLGIVLVTTLVKFYMIEKQRINKKRAIKQVCK
ncbi:MAG: threonine/serine exporter family protein [Eubacteriales bacterium]|nr:threonine/serine exporter family protein [Eubacteriales bacterium]